MRTTNEVIESLRDWSKASSQEPIQLTLFAAVTELERLSDIIRRASMQFCHDGPDGEIAAKMFTILGEAYPPNAADQRPGHTGGSDCK